MKAKELYEKALNTQDPMDKFSNLWQSFNNLFSRESGNERNKIKSFISNNVDEDLAKDIISSFNNDIAFLLSSPIKNMDNPNKNTQMDIDEFNNSSIYLEKLKALFMIIYQVRCNLFHGEKSPSRNRDIKLCDHSFNIIAEVVKKGI